MGLASARADGPEAISFGAREPLVAFLQETPADKLLPLLKPFEADKLTAYEVSRAVNTPSIDEPDLIRPVA